MSRQNEEAEGTWEVREHLVDVLLKVIAAASLVALFPSIWLSIKERVWPVLVGDVLANAWIVILALVTSIPYRVKILTLVLLPYALGVLLLLVTGPFGAGHLYIFAFVFFAAIFGNRRSIILANLLAILTHILFALGKAYDLLPWEQGLDSVIVVSSNFVLVSLVLSFSAHYLVSHYASAAAEERSMRRELETLLHEIEHRVKNNIQVVSSIVNIKARSGADPAGVLEEIKASLSAIAAVHQLLYRRNGGRRVGMRSLMEELVSRYRGLHGDVDWILEWRGAEAAVDGDRAVDLGLLVNELVMNSLKHGFPEGTKGSIFLEFEHDPSAGRLTMRIGDTGIGKKPSGDERPAHDGRGLKIVEAIARHLDARLELEAGEAWVYRLSFPVAKVAAAASR